MVAKNPQTAAWFWSRVRCGNPTDCWPYAAKPERHGYCRARWQNSQRWRVHRIAFALDHPEWNGEGCVCHSCDNRRCCNPAHLWLGTNLDNIADMMDKGRQSRVRGTQNGHAKLTDAEVLEIRRSNLLQRELAAKYGISASNISQIKTGRHWKHIDTTSNHDPRRRATGEAWKRARIAERFQ